MRKQKTFSELDPEFFEIVIDEDSPTVEATRRRVGETLALWNVDVLVGAEVEATLCPKSNPQTQPNS